MKLKIEQRNWLLSLHITSGGLWFGTALCSAALALSLRGLGSSDALYGINVARNLMGQFIIVPNGMLTGGGASGAGIEWLYRVTGQRGDTTMNIADFFAAHGFEAEMFVEECPRSIAQVIVARKRG